MWFWRDPCDGATDAKWAAGVVLQRRSDCIYDVRPEDFPERVLKLHVDFLRRRKPKSTETPPPEGSGGRVSEDDSRVLNGPVFQRLGKRPQPRMSSQRDE